MIALLLFTVLLYPGTPTEGPVVRPSDLLILTGARWSGTLTYLDYSSNRKVSIPSTLLVSGLEGQQSKFIFDYQYPKEPQARSVDTIVIANDGREFAGERVVDRQETQGGPIIIVTEKAGTDNKRKALIRHTYRIEPGNFSIKKEVRYDDTNQYLVRNEYQWAR